MRAAIFVAKNQDGSLTVGVGHVESGGGYRIAGPKTTLSSQWMTYPLTRADIQAIRNVLDSSDEKTTRE